MQLRKRALRHLGAIAALCLLLPACSPDPTPPPVPVSTMAPTPPETALERQERLDFEAAEESYRLFQAEFYQLMETGGADKATPTMKLHGAGPYLNVMTDFLRQGQDNFDYSRGDFHIAYVRPVSHSSAKLGIETCEDGSKIINYDKKGRVVGRGIVVQLELEMRRVDGIWKIWDGDDEVVKSCAG